MYLLHTPPTCPHQSQAHFCGHIQPGRLSTNCPRARYLAHLVLPRACSRQLFQQHRGLDGQISSRHQTELVRNFFSRLALANNVTDLRRYGWGDNSLGQVLPHAVMQLLHKPSGEFLQVGLLVDNDGITRNPISDPAWKTSNAPYMMRDFELPRYLN